MSRLTKTFKNFVVFEKKQQLSLFVILFDKPGFVKSRNVNSYTSPFSPANILTSVTKALLLLALKGR
jgi:hypothetical protein